MYKILGLLTFLPTIISVFSEPVSRSTSIIVGAQDTIIDPINRSAVG
jgi:hypothetical protein